MTNPQLIQQKEFAIRRSLVDKIHFRSVFRFMLQRKSFCYIKLTKIKKESGIQKTGNEKSMLILVK